MRALLLIALTACTQFDVLTEAASDEGTVYECESDERTTEWCYFDSAADELAGRLGDGWSCSTSDRLWPSITNALGVGCNYHCPHIGPGCNAGAGCYCPGGGQ